MGVLRFGPRGERLTSVYSVDRIREIYEDNPCSDRFRLTMKLGKGKGDKPSISISFKRLTGEDGLQIILGFAAMMWGVRDCSFKI